MERASRKKVANQCRGTSKCSTRKCPTCSHKTNSVPKISKYFTNPVMESNNKIDTQEAGQSVVKSAYDSPYKHSLKQINCKLNDSVNDEKDFMSPVVIGKKKTVAKQPLPKQTKSKPQQRTKRSKKGTCTFQKTIEDGFKNLDVNPDHLQMAIALSESTHHAEYPESQKQSREEMFPSFTESRQSNASLKSTLERFGFKSGSGQSRTSTFTHHEVPKKRKKSKFAYVTPILLMRTEEDREATITSKVSLILSQICTEQNSKPRESINIGSEMLQKYNSQIRRIFELNSMDLSDLNKGNLFYTCLPQPAERSRCGCLLKNWQDIPGRDVSPPRSRETSSIEDSATLMSADILQSQEVNTVQQKSVVEKPYQQELSPKAVHTQKSIRRSISPDLFCDSEDDFLESTENNLPCVDNRDNLKEFKDNNGICHFESYHENAIELSQDKIKHLSQSQNTKSYMKNQKQTGNPSDICDLTISSDEEMDDTTRAGVENKGEILELQIQKQISNEEESNTELCKNEIKLSTEDISHEEANKREIIHVSNSHKDTSMTINNSSMYDPKINNTKDDPDDDIMNEDTIILENTFTNIQSPGQGSENPQVESISNRFSVGFDYNISNESSLNITHYINSMLNKTLDVSKQPSERELHTVEDKVDNFTEFTPNKKNNQQVNPGPKHIDQQSDELAMCLTQTSSQEVQYISDEELDYSSNFKFLSKRKSKAKKKLEYQDIGDKLTTEPATDVIVLSDDSSDSVHNKTQNLKDQDFKKDVFNDSVDGVLQNLNTTLIASHISNIVSSVKPSKATPKKSTCTQDTCVATPKNTLIIKTDNVTPMPSYDNMDTPKLLKELDKIGVKPLKRQRGVQLLKYIYESTHPVVGPQEEGECSEEESEHRKYKKRKKTDDESKESEESKITCVMSQNYTKSIDNVEIVGDIVSHSENECNLIFERRQSSKVASCRIPLDIAWHNFVSSNTQIRENMLLYEPLQLEVLHSMIKDVGFKFHIQDLLTFLDRQCITVRVASNQGRAKRK